MTCVVAIRERDSNQIVMGADSAGVGGYSIQNRVDPKVFRKNTLVMMICMSLMLFTSAKECKYGTFCVHKHN